MKRRTKERLPMIVAILCVWVMFTCAWIITACSEAAVMYVNVREGTYLNGRSEPDKSSAIAMRLWRGDTVEVIAVKNDWARIIGGEAGTCWCYAACLQDCPPDAGPVSYTVVSDGRVRVRQSPDGKTVRYLRDGDAIEVRFVIGGWAYIGDGYVMAKYLETPDKSGFVEGRSLPQPFP